MPAQWPDQAETLYRETLSSDPLDNEDVEFGLACAELDQQDYESVRTAMRWLSPPYLTYCSFNDLHSTWSRHFRSEILPDTRFGRSSSDTFGSKQFDTGFWWFTYPWRLNNRAYMQTFDSWAGFQEGDHARRRRAGGIEYRHDRCQLTSELSGNRFDFDTPGGRLQADYRASDQWQLDAEADVTGYATLLRADRADIASDRHRVRARYRHSEWRDLSGELAYQPQWQLSPRLSIRGGVQLNQRVHDGNDEETWYVRFGLAGYLRACADQLPRYFRPPQPDRGASPAVGTGSCRTGPVQDHRLPRRAGQSGRPFPLAATGRLYRRQHRR